MIEHVAPADKEAICSKLELATFLLTCSSALVCKG
jgi:hypothetical protein